LGWRGEWGRRWGGQGVYGRYFGVVFGRGSLYCNVSAIFMLCTEGGVVGAVLLVLYIVGVDGLLGADWLTLFCIAFGGGLEGADLLLALCIVSCSDCQGLLCEHSNAGFLGFPQIAQW